LALSIGALTLVGKSPNDLQNLILSIIYYGFSFFVLIRVWISYTQTITHVSIETTSGFNLNILMLFLVSVEPFLFNRLLTSSLTQYVSVIYALDLGGLLFIQALLAHSIISTRIGAEKMLNHYRLARNGEIIGATVFFVSALPFFWTWAIPLNDANTVPLRFTLWIIPVLIPFVRPVLER